MGLKQVLPLIILAALAAPAGAGAVGTYEVVACDAAGGPNHSWRAQAGSPTIFASRQRCPALGEYDGFGMRSSTAAATAPQLASSWWRFDAPAGTSIAALEWAGHYATSGHGWAARVESSRAVFGGCGPSARACERQWANGAKPVRFEANGAGWIRVGAVCVAATGCQTGDGRSTPYVDASTWFAKVVVRDPAPPVMTASGRVLEQSWTGQGSTVSVSASDASGISRLALLIDGELASERSFECDRTRPTPCDSQSAGFELPRAVTDGRHTLTLMAVDAAGNEQRKDFSIGVDTTAPVAPSAPVVDGPDAWRTDSRFSIRIPLPEQGTAAPLSAALVQICPERTRPSFGECLPTRRIELGSATPEIGVVLPYEGQWSARVTFEDTAGNRDERNTSPPASLSWDRTPPGAGAVTAPRGWLTRSAARLVTVSASPDQAFDLPLSGIAGWAFAIDALPGQSVDLAGPTPQIPLADLPQGVSELSFRAIGGSGVASRSVATALVRIDETPPEVEIAGVPQGDWSTGPVGLVARGRDQADLSGMGSGEESHAGVRLSVDGAPAELTPGDEALAEIAADGVHRIWAEAVDAAGNSSGRRAATVRIDATPPDRLAFLPQDPADPRSVRVDATDATSGIASVEVRMRKVAGGQWIAVGGEFDGDRFSGAIDESELSTGLWELEATALDRAGNRRASMRVIGGDPAVVAIPLRRTSRIEASFSRIASSASAASGSVTVSNGSGADVSGRLLDGLGDPIPGALVALSSAVLAPGARWIEGGACVTDRGGRFSFHLPAGPGRHVRLSFEGNHSLVPALAAMTMRVPAQTSLAVSPGRVKAGRTAVFHGRLNGGHIPSGGKLVMVQAQIPKRGWQTFAVARANSSGDWSASYRFRTNIGTDGYLIRAVVPAEAAYPFGRSETRPVRVRGAG